MNRRQFAATAGAALLATGAHAQPETEKDSWQPVQPSSGPKLEIAMLVFPEMYSLDLIGPYTFMAGMTNAEVHLVWKNLDPVAANKGIRIVPTATLEECPKQLDILFVPGGTTGVNMLMRDDAVLDFVADRGTRARYVTSVCTGALVLGAAGLLKGYKAATHWAAMSLLPIFGATPTYLRVVEDRNRITGGGVTAGIDFGLTISARFRGENFAKMAQLAMEYNPQPPFHSGSPKTASPELVAYVEQLTAKGHEESRVLGQEAVKRRGIA